MSKISKIREYFNELLKQANKDIIPYNKEIIRIKNEIKVLNDCNSILFKQNFKQLEVIDYSYDSYHKLRTIFIDNYKDIVNKNHQIIHYLETKLTILELQVDYIYINVVLKIAFCINYELHNSFHTNQLKYKRYAFIYDILKQRGYQTEGDRIFNYNKTHYNWGFKKCIYHSYIVPLDELIEHGFNLGICITLKVIPKIDVYKHTNRIFLYIKKQLSIIEQMKLIDKEFKSEFDYFSNDDEILDNLIYTYDSSIRTLREEAKNYHGNLKCN